MCRFNSNLIICSITIFKTQIIIFAIDIDIRKNKLKKIRILFVKLEKKAFQPTISLIHAQMIRVISSPSNSTTGLATLIRFCGAAAEA
jgi:hypothetical protein